MSVAISVLYFSGLDSAPVSWVAGFNFPFTAQGKRKEGL